MAKIWANLLLKGFCLAEACKNWSVLTNWSTNNTLNIKRKFQWFFYSVNIHEAANSLSPSQAFQQNLPQRRQDISQIPPAPVLTFMGNRNTHGLGGAMGNRKTHGFPSSSSNNKEGASLSQIFSPSILHLIPDTKTMQEKLFDVDQVSCPLEFYFSFW